MKYNKNIIYALKRTLISSVDYENRICSETGCHSDHLLRHLSGSGSIWQATQSPDSGLRGILWVSGEYYIDEEYL